MCLLNLLTIYMQLTKIILLFVLYQLSVILKKNQHKIHQIDNWIYLIGLIKRINFNPVCHTHLHPHPPTNTIDS